MPLRCFYMLFVHLGVHWESNYRISVIKWFAKAFWVLVSPVATPGGLGGSASGGSFGALGDNVVTRDKQGVAWRVVNTGGAGSATTSWWATHASTCGVSVSGGSCGDAKMSRCAVHWGNMAIGEHAGLISQAFWSRRCLMALRSIYSDNFLLLFGQPWWTDWSLFQRAAAAQVEAEECPAANVHEAERRQILLVEGREGAETVLTTTMGVETASLRPLWSDRQYPAPMTEEEQIVKVEALLAL
jgi:hypothetical protein